MLNLTATRNHEVLQVDFIIFTTPLMQINSSDDLRFIKVVSNSACNFINGDFVRGLLGKLKGENERDGEVIKSFSILIAIVDAAL